MKVVPTFATMLEKFFCQRLISQKGASPNTIKAYSDTFHLLLEFVAVQTGRLPSDLELSQVDAPIVIAFLDEIERGRNVSARTRNARLSAIRSFFRYAALEVPAHSDQIQRILAIPAKRTEKSLVHFLTRSEISALLDAPNRLTWSGCRDHALLLVAVQTGMRVSELTGLQVQDVVLGAGAHVRILGKGRKERCTPLTKQTTVTLSAWMRQRQQSPVASEFLFPNARGGRLSTDGVQYILDKCLAAACEHCPSLKQKRVTPHVLRHSMAMELLQAGVDRALIALWLGHESVETTQVYLHANLAMKEAILAKTCLPGAKPDIYRPTDRILSFLRSL